VKTPLPVFEKGELLRQFLIPLFEKEGARGDLHYVTVPSGRELK
jgi:hypothetical protein